MFWENDSSFRKYVLAESHPPTDDIVLVITYASYLNS